MSSEDFLALRVSNVLLLLFVPCLGLGFDSMLATSLGLGPKQPGGAHEISPGAFLCRLSKTSLGLAFELAVQESS